MFRLRWLPVLLLIAMFSNLAIISTPAHAFAQAAASPTTDTQPVDCSKVGLWDGPGAWATCAGRAAAASIGAFLIFLAGWVLWLSGAVFDYAITFTIIEFGPFIFGKTPVAAVISSAWMVFRDVANIAIIGMFVFIAISIILGNSSYGDKKLIARVLIVATLINFSFLFTKIIINISNVIAIQVYSATTLPKNAAQNGIAAVHDDGIAARIMAATGIQALGKQNLEDEADRVQSGWVALIHALIATIVILIAAVILAYGTVILATRAIVFILILITGAIAFATYLIPTLAEGEYGWKAWWRALLGNAALAPILMIFLTITLSVARGIKFTLKGSISGLESQAQGFAAIAPLFGYFIVMGLLYASFKISSSLASHIGGFGTAQAGVLTPFAAAARYGAAPILRGTVGRGYAKAAHSTQVEIDKKVAQRLDHKANSPEFAALTKDIAGLTRKKTRQESVAKRSFDVMNPLGKVAGALGVPKTLTQASKKSYFDTTHKKAEAAAKTASGQVLSKDKAEDIVKGKEPQHKEALNAIAEERKINTGALNTALANAADIKKKEGLDEARKAALAKADDAGKVIAESTAAHKADNKSNDDHDQILREQETRIEAARSEIDRVDKRGAEIDLRAEPFRAHARKLDQDEKEINNRVTAKAKVLIDDSKEGAKETAAHLSRGPIARVFHTFTGHDFDPAVAKEAREQAKKKISAKPIIEQEKNRIQALKEAGGGTEPAAPTTPAAKPDHE